jgi:hypothetical protein
MRSLSRLRRLVPTAAVVAVALASVAATFNANAQEPALRNATTGGPLRPGVYGRVVVRGATPPPVIYQQPVIATQVLVPATAQPTYLYVPSGQVRKWKQHCAKWQACDQPVLFVRMDANPGRWGQWRQKREQVASAE